MTSRKNNPNKQMQKTKTILGGKYTNDVVTISDEDLSSELYGPNRYSFLKPPSLLFFWSRLFQCVISQAGTYMLTQKFHGHDCAIGKTEGGCRIDKYGELVLGTHSIYWNYGSDKKTELKQLVTLLNQVVMAWDPSDPIESMLSKASEIAQCDKEELRTAIAKSGAGGVFGGNALSSFFNWNPFSPPPRNDEYIRFCRVDLAGEDPKVVDQQLADKALGYELLDKMEKKGREYQRANGNRYMSLPMCCSPRRDGNGKLMFWINTGTDTQLDGWKTQEEIEAYLKTDGRIIKTKS